MPGECCRIEIDLSIESWECQREGSLTSAMLASGVHRKSSDRKGVAS